MIDSSPTPVRPLILLSPIGVTADTVRGGAVDGDDADPKMALASEPIVGLERVTYDEKTGPGALAARPLTSPKSMTPLQRAIHDLTHLPYDPGCGICVSTRRPNVHHRSLTASERTIPLLVGDYCFPKHSDDDNSLTVLVMRVYPYKLFFVCVVPAKGRDPRIISRLERFIKECGLVHFTFRSDREPSIVAMLEEACALCGRHGLLDNGDSTGSALSHDQLVTDDGSAVAPDPTVEDEPHTPSSKLVPTSHTAAPEMTHPGESQSNGLAERSVGVWEDQFRTLKHALELRLKRRIPSEHPVISWLVEHTAWVLNKYHFDSAGRTAYGRLHGREGHERICEFGERIMWYVPKKLRSKLDQRWKYGIFLGRSLSSDQNFIGLSSGDVVCARAIVRVVPEMRWSPDAIEKIRATPLTFRSGTLDVIEESTDPNAHPEPAVAEDGDGSRQMRRLKIMDTDVRKFGFTDSCQRCQYMRQNQHALARGCRHSEECRERIYDAMREAGDAKINRADGEERTAVRPRRPVEPSLEPSGTEPAVVPMAEDAPAEPLTPMADEIPDVEPNIPPPTPTSEPRMADVGDTTDFHDVVNDDDLVMEWTGPDLVDGDGDHMMSSLISVLQTNGVSVGDAVNFAVNVIKSRPPTPVSFGAPYNPTFFELYGHGSLVNASHGCRRNLNLNGLRALDLRTTKPNGAPWNFCSASDRQLARTLVETEKPTWLIGSPPCTFSRHGIKE